MAANRSSACPRCTAPLVEIHLAAGAAELALRSCSRCDGRWWMRDGVHTDINGVLTDVRAPGREAARSA